MSTVSTEHIRLDDRGVAWIDDANVKVIEVALDYLTHGWSAEEIHLQHYRQLSLAQIYAALAYYHDHPLAIDAEIERQVRDYEKLRAQALDSPGRARIRALGKLP
jgi:uncharacterized protein (DUF433 family)